MVDLGGAQRRGEHFDLLQLLHGTLRFSLVCYSCVTLSLVCYSCVTRVLPLCYSCATTVLLLRYLVWDPKRFA